MKDDLCVCTPNIEVIWIQLILKDTRPTFIACIYQPPSGDLESALDTLEDHVLCLKSRHHACDIVIMGDYNVDSLKPRTADSKKLTEFRNKLSLKSLIKQPTYYQNGYHSSLDDILISNPDYYNVSGTIETGDTDHSLIFTTRKKKKIHSEPCYFYGRTYTRFNPLLFQRDCIFTNWSDVLSQDDPVLAGTSFYRFCILCWIGMLPSRRCK